MTNQEWYNQYSILTNIDVFLIKDHIETFKVQPKISLLTPVYNTRERWLRKCVASVLRQLYRNWELCLCDNACNEATSKILREIAALDPRIKIVRLDVNQGGFGGTNAALDLATGDYIGFLDSDDEITDHALYLIAEKINRHPDANVVYTDEVMINADDSYGNAFFKPDFSPHLLHSQLPISHLSVWKGSLLKELRLRESAGSHDYDLTLRTSEIVPWSTFYHIPVLAYKYRIHSDSTASKTYSYCVQGAVKALQEHLDRLGRKAKVMYDWPWYRVKYEIDTYPHVDILVASINKNDLLYRFIDNLFAKTNYPDYTLILAVPENIKEWTIQRFGAFVDSGKIKFAERHEAKQFSYSHQVNNLNKVATGPIICLMGDDVEPLNYTWLEEMVSLAILPETGVVGAKLLYPNLTIQHAGVVLGMFGTAAHMFKGQPNNSPGYFGRVKLVGNFSMVTGACCVMRKEIFDKVGGFEEKLQVAYNDVDFCIKVMKEGYYNVYTPYANLIHYECATRGLDSTAQQQEVLAFETKYLQEKWKAELNHDKFFNPNLSLNSINFDLAEVKDSRYKKPWLK